MEEGYVKYRAEHRDAPAIEPPGWAALNKGRTLLHDLRLVGVYPNGVGYGNVSLRVGREAFLISGTATGEARELTAAQYCLVTSFDLEKNTVRTEGPVPASSESMSHGAVYRALPAAASVIHIHSRPVFDGLLAAGAPATPPEALFGTPEMALAIQAAAQKTGVDQGWVVMTGHDEGVIVYAASVEWALNLTLELYRQYGGVMIC